ncbi:MAG: MATE family efflux transporter [Firmicutes bacterium]|nr:MATE family efflux transporter [Bacillota bacterium]
MSELSQNKMGTAPVGRLLLTMSVPSILSMLVQALYNVVDSIFVAKISPDALTAVSLAFPVQTLMIAVGVGTAVGVNSLISRRLGERRHEEAEDAARHGLFLALLASCVFALFGIFAVGPFFHAFTDSESVAGLGITYTSIVTIGSLGLFLQVTVERIFQATGNMTIPMTTQLTGAIINIIFDPILIFGMLGFPAFGIAGAAYATVLGQVVGMLLGLSLLLWSKKSILKLRLRSFRPNGRILKDIYAVGFPAMIMQSIMSVLTVALNAILIGFSDAAVSVLGVYYKLQSFIFMPVFGLTQGAMPIMGFNFGARSRQRLMHCLKLACAAAFAIMTAGMTLFLAAPEWLLGFFSPTDEMLQIGAPALRTISLCFPLAAFGIMFSTFFQAIGHGVKSLLISLLRQLVIILPFAWIFAHTIGLSGVWYAFPLSELISFAASLGFLSVCYRKEIAPMPENGAPGI